MLADVTDLLTGRREQGDAFAGTLRVGIYPGSLEWVLTNSLAELVRRHPSVRLDINIGTSERGLRLLARGDIDVACGLVEAFRVRKEIRCSPIDEVRMQCFVRHGHPLLRRGNISLEDKLEFGFVTPSLSAPYAETIRQVYKHMSSTSPATCTSSTSTRSSARSSPSPTPSV